MPASSSTELPFELALSERADASWPVTIDAGDEETASEIADLLDGLCAISRLGCLVTPPGHVGGASLRPSATLDGRQWTGEVEALALDPAFWRVFLQMCAQYHHVVAPIRRVTLGTGMHHPLAAPYPAAPLIDEVEIVRAAIEPETPAVIRLDATSWSSESADAARRAFEDWGSVVYAGGFHPVSPAMEESAFDDLAVNVLGRTRLECVMRGWRSVDAAIDCALALCVGIHRLVQPLSRVEVE